MNVGTPGLTGPRMVGRYALYDRIASGGMASVHIGRLIGPVGFARTVAIKQMHPQLAEDPEFVAMFLDEARLAARIRHPNVVPTLDVVALAGELFLVMDFVQGESLARLIRGAVARRQHIPPEMVAGIMVGVLHGLHAAHEAKSDRGEALGLVHRDISPHNVMVGVDGVARVLDFGVAKAVGRIQTTREGQLKGKIPYMAPEQARGEVSRVTDVYAASVVLWETLTCKRLFTGENELQLFEQVMKGAHAPPSAYAPNVPPALDEVALRGLSVDPTKRFQTAREMADAIEAAIPLATASKTGDWVEEVAKERLDECSARIATIENDSSGRGAPPPSQSPPEQRPARMAPPSAPIPIAREDATVAVTEDMILTQFSGSASSANPIPVRRDPRKRIVAAAAGAGVLLVVTVAAISWSSRKPTATAAGAASAPSVSASEAPEATLAASASAAPPAPSDSVATTVAPPAAPATTTRPPPVHYTPPAPPKASTNPHCNPPWYFNARGVRSFKPECL